MITLDTNILVYAHREETSEHERALAALRELAEGVTPWLLPASVITEFLRVVTHPRILSPPSSSEQAMAAVEAVLASPTVRVVAPGPRHWQLMRAAMTEGAAKGNVVLDAQIVAVAREHGGTTILSADRDFRRFPSIELELFEAG